MSDVNLLYTDVEDDLRAERSRPAGPTGATRPP